VFYLKGIGLRGSPPACRASLGKRIISSRVKGMAFQKADDCQNASLEDPVFLDGKASIGGA